MLVKGSATGSSPEGKHEAGGAPDNSAVLPGDTRQMRGHLGSDTHWRMPHTLRAEPSQVEQTGKQVPRTGRAP